MGSPWISKLLSKDLGLIGICPPYIIACWETEGDCLGVVILLGKPWFVNILKDDEDVTFYLTVIVAV